MLIVLSRRQQHQRMATSGQDSGRGTEEGGDEKPSAILFKTDKEEWRRRMDEYWGIGKPLFPPDAGEAAEEEDNSIVGRQETEDENRERSEELKRRLKALHEACKLPQLTGVCERSKEENRRTEEATPEKKELERHQRESLILEASVMKRRAEQTEKLRVERVRDMTRRKEMAEEEERKAVEMRKEKREEERQAAERRLDALLEEEDFPVE